jgi:hypothetical protein
MEHIDAWIKVRSATVDLMAMASAGVLHYHILDLDLKLGLRYSRFPFPRISD